MTTTERQDLQKTREQARMLSLQLRSLRNTDAVVIAASDSSILLARAIANSLMLNLYVIPCARIKHPAIDSKCIGSISAEDIVIDPFDHDIPQDYISHQVALTRSALKATRPASANLINLKSKVVVLVHSTLQHIHDISACLMSVNKRCPQEVIVVTPEISADAARTLRATVSDVKFISMCETESFGASARTKILRASRSSQIDHSFQ